MKVRLLFFSLIFTSVSIVYAQNPAQAPAQQKDIVAEKTEQIATRLKLSDEKKGAVYKILSQTDKRINDLAFGTPDYTKLINYINQERSDMLKGSLSVEEFSEYQKNFASKDMAEISKYISQNNTFMTKKATEELKNKKDEERLMNADKMKAKKEELKAKENAKKEELKQKAAEKKQREKDKATEKKERDKQKAAERKQKEQEKKEAAKQKALEKKQKELEKKLNKK